MAADKTAAVASLHGQELLQDAQRAEDARDAATEAFKALSPEERSKLIVSLILEELDEDKAEEIVRIDLSGKSEIADVMIIASGRSQRHVGAMADKILRKLKAAGAGPARSEGQPACDWVLIDAGDAILHLFRPEVRAFYNLERIWSEAAHPPAAQSSHSSQSQPKDAGAPDGETQTTPVDAD